MNREWVITLEYHDKVQHFFVQCKSHYVQLIVEHILFKYARGLDESFKVSVIPTNRWKITAWECRDTSLTAITDEIEIADWFKQISSSYAKAASLLETVGWGGLL